MRGTRNTSTVPLPSAQSREAVVTIAIMWAGYKFLFKHADIAEVGKILAGGLLIGGAAELARYIVGTST